jgi:hypothetical protein
MGCEHHRAEPVDLLVAPHERVAWVCPACWDQLPADWVPASRIEGLLAQFEAAERRAVKLRELGAGGSGVARKLDRAMADIRGEITYLTRGAP